MSKKQQAPYLTLTERYDPDHTNLLYNLTVEQWRELIIQVRPKKEAIEILEEDNPYTINYFHDKNKGRCYTSSSADSVQLMPREVRNSLIPPDSVEFDLIQKK
eukprot:Pgem_evm1s15623